MTEDDKKKGWVKLYRVAIEKEWLKNPKLWTFLSYCLLKATHKKREAMVGYQRILLEPGQFIFGRKVVSKELRMSEQNIRTCLSNLKKLEFLTIKVTNKYSVVTVVNWGLYQGDDVESNQLPNQQLTSKSPTTNQQLTTDKNVKKVKNEKKDIYSENPFYEEVFKILNDHVLGKYNRPLENKQAQFKTIGGIINNRGVSEDEFVRIVRWVTKDDFWSEKIRSFNSLSERLAHDKNVWRIHFIQGQMKSKGVQVQETTIQITPTTSDQWA